MKGNLSSAFLLLIDNHILEHVRICTELEASRVLGKNWTITQAKLKAFLAILYARGAYEGNTLRLQYLWNNKWGPSFFSSTMSRRDFTEILRYIRFDKRNQRSQRLQTDKFALVSAVWDKFIENSRNCFKQKLRELVLPWMSNSFQRRPDADLPSICQTNPINLA